MSDTCLKEEMTVVYETTEEAVDFEQSVNYLLDVVNEQKKRVDNITKSLNEINEKSRNYICIQDNPEDIILTAKNLIRILRSFVAEEKKHKLWYSALKTAFINLSETTNLFEEYMQDFKFRHDRDIQKDIHMKLSDLSLSL